MSEREYFSLRYAVPGYTFVLLVVWFNLSPLFNILKAQEASSIFAGFLTVFSGSAIGFLVSQLWWRWFHWRDGLYNWKPVTSTIDKYRLKHKTREDKLNVWSVFDYVLQSDLHTKPEWTGLSRHCYRRWDMYIILSCTMTSLILGTTVGAFLRVVYEVFMTNFLSRLKIDFWFFVHVGEFWILIVALVIAPIFWFLLKRERNVIKSEYEWMHDVFIKRFAIEPIELGRILEHGIFRSDEETES